MIPNRSKFRVLPIATSKKDSGKKLKSKEEMREWYCKWDFLLVTSTNEGTSNPGLESLSCGTPVITTRVGNMVEIIKDDENGFYAEPTFKSFYQKINEVCDGITNDRYQEMRKAARKSVEKDWDWKEKSKEWVKFLCS